MTNLRMNTSGPAAIGQIAWAKWHLRFCAMRAL